MRSNRVASPPSNAPNTTVFSPRRKQKTHDIATSRRRLQTAFHASLMPYSNRVHNHHENAKTSQTKKSAFKMRFSHVKLSRFSCQAKAYVEQPAHRSVAMPCPSRYSFDSLFRAFQCDRRVCATQNRAPLPSIAVFPAP